MAHNHHFGDISGGGGNVIAPVEAPEDAAAQEAQAVQAVQAVPAAQAVQAVQAVPAAQEVQAAQVAQVAAGEAPGPVQAANFPSLAPLVLPPIMQAAPAVEEMRGFYAVLPVAQANQAVQVHAAAPVAAAFGAAAAAAAAVAHPGAGNVLAVPVAYHSAAHPSVNIMAAPVQAPVQVQARAALWEAPRHLDAWYDRGPTLREYANNNNNKRFLAAATYAAAGNGGNHNDNNNNNAEDLTTEMTEEKKRQKEEQAELTNCIAAKRLKTDPELEEALSSGKLSDVLLRFPDSSETIPAHRLMLAKGSPTFEAMFSTDMVEKLKGEVMLQDVRPEVMRLVLRFLYNAKPLEQEELQMHAVELYKAGHMYQIEGLKKLAELALLVNAQQAADDEAKQLVATAELYGLKELRQRTLTAVKNRLVTKIKGAPLDKHLLNIEAVVNAHKQLMRRIKNQLMMNLTNK